MKKARWAYALAFAVGLVVGVVVGWPQKTEPAPPDLTSPAGVMRLDNPGATHQRLRPFRIVTDGKAQDVPGVPRSGEVWRIDLADGRVIIFATAE